MANIIHESGMDFIADNTYHVEKSELYLCLGEGIKSIEFIRIKDGNLLFVEAKMTFPNPDNVESSERFASESDDVCNKFIHSLNLLSSITVGVIGNVVPFIFDIPEKTSIIFVLVIKNHKTEWCRKIKHKLMASFPYYLKKIWKPSVYVINHETATRRGLTASTVC